MNKIVLLAPLVLLMACTDADVASNNLSKAADMFEECIAALIEYEKQNDK